MTKVIVINGYSGSGKNTFVDFFKNHYGNETYYISSVDYVRDWAREHLGYNGERTNEARQMLCTCKKLLVQWNDSPYQVTCELVDKKIKEGYKYIFIDCREPEEIMRYVARYNAQTLLIKRKYRDWVIPNNDSDMNVEKMTYDITIYNNGSLEDLEKEAINLYNDLI